MSADGLLILVVEDHERRAKALAEAIWQRSNVAAVRFAPTAGAAIEALGAERFDAVLLDFDLDLDGTASLVATGSGMDVASEIARRGGPPTVVHSRNFMQAQAVVAMLLRAGVGVAWAPVAGRIDAAWNGLQTHVAAAMAVAIAKR